VTYDTDLTNDFIFRHIFGDERNNDLLKYFVNTVLEAKGLAPVVEISPVSPFVPVEDLTQREGILDVRAKDTTGRNFDLEIQVRPQSAYIRRSLYYLARMYGGQLSRGIDYREITPCVGIHILDFTIFQDSAFAHHLFAFRSKDEPNRVLSEDLCIHYLELPKIGRSGIQISQNLKKLLYLLKGIRNPEDAMIKEITDKEPALDRLKTEFERVMTDEQLRNEALSHEMWLHDQAQYQYEVGEERYNKGRMEGLEQGKAEGLAEGEEKARQELARNMKVQGFDLDVISKLTRLSIQVIEAL